MKKIYYESSAESFFYYGQSHKMSISNNRNRNNLYSARFNVYYPMKIKHSKDKDKMPLYLAAIQYEKNKGVYSK